MGKKNKKAERKADKRKRNNDQEQKRLLSMNEIDLLNEGDTLLSSGYTRDAIKLYQMAVKIVASKVQNISPQNYAISKQNDQNHKNTEFMGKVKSKLFVAYATRAKELKNKSMFSEAKAMENQAIASISSPSILDTTSMKFFLRICSPEEAFKSYNQFHLQNKGLSSEELPSLDLSSLEMILAEILIKHNCWENLDFLNDDITLKKDALLIKPALLLMNSGEWDSALEIMKYISRSSAVAHVKLFCKSMSAFYKNNNSEMLKAILMIPKESMFIKITDTLKHSASINVADSFTKLEIKNPHDYGSKEFKESIESETKANLAIQKCLWGNSIEIYDKLDNIITLAKKESYNDYLQKNIIEFVRLLMPEHTESVLEFILETLYQIDSNNQYQFFRMAEKLLNKKSRFFRVKRDAVFVKELFLSGLEYFPYLDKEFVTLEEQKIAKAMLIEYMVLEIVHNNAYGFVAQIIKKEPKYLKLLGITSKDGKVATLEMIQFAVNLDPQNRKLYELLNKIPLIGNDAKDINENILILQCDAFPEEPEPRLQLASFYHFKNAYRKAELTLQKALELAPHDAKVMDQHVISLLISADRSAGKKKFNLSWHDIEKAKRFNSKQCAILIAEKSIFYKIAEKGEIQESEIEHKINSFSLSDKLKCYALLMSDMENKLKSKNYSPNVASYNLVESLFKNRLMRLEELTSYEILNLLLPLPKEWIHLFNKIDLTTYFINKSKNAVLTKLEDRDLLILIEKNDDYRIYPNFINELNSRVKENSRKKTQDKKCNENNKLNSKILEFYQITLKNISQTSHSYYVSSIYDKYSKFISGLEPETKKILKGAAIKLSKKAFGPLKEALETFNFEILLHPRVSHLSFFDDDDLDDNFNQFNNNIDNLIDLQNFDLDSAPPIIIQMITDKLNKLINTSEGTHIRESLDDAIYSLDELVDKHNLRGKTEQELKDIKKKIAKDRENKFKIDMINIFYKEEAIKKFSKEAKILFIQ